MTTYGSAFSGIGGFDLGLERAGMEPRWQVEINEWCCQVLEKHWPGLPRKRDIRNVGRHNLEPVDVICGGPPCQPFSTAGKRLGAADDRNLWPEMLRVVSEMRPRWFVGENSPNLANLYLDVVKAELEDQGYEVWCLDIPAAAVAAPHLRHRLWILAYSEGVGRIWDRKFGEESLAVWLGAYAFGGCQDVSDAQRLGWGESAEVLRGRKPESAVLCEDVGGVANRDASGQGLLDGTGTSLAQSSSIAQPQRPDRGDGVATHADGEPSFRPSVAWGQQGYWPAEPGIRRVVDGVPRRVDRLRGLGNAVVPLIPELIGRGIMAIEAYLGSDK